MSPKHYTEYTQKNGAVSLYSPLKPHHSFVYTLYIAYFITDILENIAPQILNKIVYLKDTVRIGSRTTVYIWMYTATTQSLASNYILYILNILYI
jgi:hypothetical protein